MTILPIKLISELDQPLYGANIYNLAKLERLGLPVKKGVAITPPEIIMQTILKYYEDGNKEIFEQRLEIIKKEILKILPPLEFNQEIEKLGYRKKEISLIWGRLLNLWLAEICSIILREGLSQGINSQLTSQTVFAPGKYKETVTAYFDNETCDGVIKSEKKLDPKILKQIDELVTLANKKLFIPQVYKFVLEGDKVSFLSLSPFTQTMPLSKEKDIVLPKAEQKRVIKSAVKIFLNLSQGFSLGSFVDGVLIEGEKTAEIHNLQTWFEATAFKLAEASLSFPQCPVIFKLPDIKDKEVRGTLRLLNHESIFKHSVDVFLFVKNKKNLLNIELAVPLLRAPQELSLIKKTLESRGVRKIWIEAGVPENFINLDDYLKIGISGVILNLDELQKNLGGYGIHEGEFYKNQVDTLIRFLVPALKMLHKNMVPVLVKGELVFYHEVLDFLIETGVFGIVVNTALEADNLPEQLSFAEKRMVLKRMA